MNLNYKKNRNKLFVILNVVGIVGLSFLFHNLFKWFPSYITSIFPVNESLYEHLKMIFVTDIIISLIIYAIFMAKGITIKNFYWALLITTVFNILIFYLPYLPIYYQFGEHMAITIGLYILSVIISQLINYIIISKKKMDNIYNTLSIFIIIIIFGILMYFTYNPLRNDFFKDPLTKEYGFTLTS